MSEGNPRVPELEPDAYSEQPSAASGCGCTAVLQAATTTGIGAAANGATHTDPSITISITPTTGGQFDITVDKNESVENLKKIISKRLKVAKERICLLHRERQLRDGTLEENRLQDGSRLTLLPSVESGLLLPRQQARGSSRVASRSQLLETVLSLQAQRPEQSVMQALESLSDSQVNDFLSGKAPLNLTMRLGDHMMLIQLQLSTVTPATTATTTTTTTTAAPTPAAATVTSTGSVATSTRSASPQTITTQQPAAPELLQNAAIDATHQLSSRSASAYTEAGQTPSKLSLSSASPSVLMASPIPSPPNTPTSPSPLFPCCPAQQQQQQQQQQQIPLPSSLSTPPTTPPANARPPQQPPALQHHHRRHRHLHNTARPPYHHHHHHHHRNAYRKVACGQVGKPSCPSCLEEPTLPSMSTSTTPITPPATDSNTKCSEFSLILGQCDCSESSPKKKLCISSCPHAATSTTDEPQESTTTTTVDQAATTTTTTTTDASAAVNPSATLDTRALVEASRNLTQKLKQLSSEENAKRRQGAIIESMHHHGKGVYTGTFSGTLNPALQDRHGRPKRDISTIIHILNDLLCATPATTAGHYRYHHRHPAAAAGQRAPASSTALLSAPATTGQSSPSMFAAASTLGPAATTTTMNAGTVPVNAEANAPSHMSNPGYSSEFSKENEATKGKMRRLRLVMEQRREKMRARRQARAAPYTTKWAAMTPDPDPNASSSSSTSSSPSSGNTTSDPQNEPELQPCSPEPVVA